MAKDEVAADLAEFDEQYSLQQQNNDNYVSYNTFFFF